jgi:hypothetical protein
MTIDEQVFVRPQYSYAFGGQWGIIVSIDPSNLLPYQVKFEDAAVPYGFSRDELLSVQQYQEIGEEAHIDYGEVLV